MTNKGTIKNTMEKFGIKKMYDAFEPWLKECGYKFSDLPLLSQNEDGEPVIVNTVEQDDEIVWKTSALQKNGWMRVNCYYKDGTYDETYKR